MTALRLLLESLQNGPWRAGNKHPAVSVPVPFHPDMTFSRINDTLAPTSDNDQPDNFDAEHTHTHTHVSDTSICFLSSHLEHAICWTTNTLKQAAFPASQLASQPPITSPQTRAAVQYLDPASVAFGALKTPGYWDWDSPSHAVLRETPDERKRSRIYNAEKSKMVGTT